jgi:hypothetical protein
MRLAYQRDGWSVRSKRRRQQGRRCVVDFLPCGQAAEDRDERWGVWGGFDRSIRPGRRKEAA